MSGPGAGEAAARLEREVRDLARPEGRVVGTAGHQRAREHLEQRLRTVGLAPYAEEYALPYRRQRLDFANLVGVAGGRDADAAPVLLAAHYDTAGPWPGADDNAAAVAIALELGARLRERPADRDVLIALFDAEEPPFFLTPAMGSIHFHAQQMRRAVHAMFALDLVGHEVPVPGAGDVVFVTGMESDPDLERTVLGLPVVPSARIVTALNRYVGDLSDHHAFRLDRIPYLFWTCGHWAHYHQPTDVPDELDYPKMAGLADLLEHAVRDVASRPLAGPWEGYDTTPTDLRTMREGMGHLLDELGLPLASRSDIDRAVVLLRQTFGL